MITTLTQAHDLDVRAAFDDGRLYILRSSISCRVYGAIDLIHVMSKPAGGEIRGYQRPKDTTTAWRPRTPDHVGPWFELDAEVVRIIGEDVDNIPDITIECSDSDSGPWSMTLREYLTEYLNSPIYPDSDEAKMAVLAIGESATFGGGSSPEYTITRTA